MNKLLSGFVCGALAMSAYAGSLPEKINMLLVDVGSIDTVSKTEKIFQQIPKVSLQKPPMPSPADGVVEPELRREAAYINWKTAVAEYHQSREDARRENERRRAVLNALRNGITGSSENRAMVMAKDYLAVALDEYSDFITLIERSESSLSEVEKKISNHDQEDVAPATLFLSVTLGDQKTTSSTVPVGDTMVKKTTWKRPATAKVCDFNGQRVFSCEVTATASFRQTDIAEDKGFEQEAELIQDAMKQIGAKVAEKFVKDYTVTVTVPKKLQEEISADEIELYLDRQVKKVKDEDGTMTEEVVDEGTQITSGEPFRALAIAHTVTAVCGNEEFKLNQSVVKLDATKRNAKFQVSKKPVKKANAEDAE